MKKLTTSLFLTFFASLFGFSQMSETQKLNLDFEENGKGFPVKWQNFGSTDYNIYVDSTSARSGNFSAVIESTEVEANFGALSLTLPNNYKGNFIRLSGYIKTENVTGGYAGLWIRIDPQVAFDNMNGRGPTGTTAWKEFEITLPLKPNKTDQIVIGALLVGKGKMWIDGLRVTVDGKGLDDPNLEPYLREILPAEKDKEFDGGSNIVFPDLDSKRIHDLELLGKIWGFLKYHHPEVAKGNYNWDYELFRFLPAYLASENNDERDKVLTAWIQKYGEIPACEGCKPTANDAVLKPDLSWITNSNLSAALKSLLKRIYDNRNQGEHYYITLHPSVGNPDFTNERSYSNMSYPDKGFRLLSLYRYWNMIEYFFPNRHLTDKDWNTVLKEYISIFLNAKNELEYELAAVRLIGEINDTHANLWGGGDKIFEMKGNNYAPFKAEFIENKYVVTDYYNPELSEISQMQIGDVITHINGSTVEAITDSLRPYYPSSNNAALLRDISNDLLRSAKETLELKYISEKGIQTRDVTLYPWKKFGYKLNEGEKSFKLLDGNIGYITLASIKEEDIPEIKKSFIDCKGIIIDIRNYPSTFVPFALGSFFVSEPTAFVKFTQGNPYNPGEFTFREGAPIRSDGNKYQGKLVVLVNEDSQSQAEYTAMAFRAAENSTIIGSTTAGADGNVSAILLPGGLRTMISGIGVYYPDGMETQRVGIVPDVIVRPTIEGIKKGKDEVLEKAIEIINQ